MKDQVLRIHAFRPCSRVNGPGRRAVLWVQGCSLRCPGCFNPETHPFEGGQVVSVEALGQRLMDLRDGLEGLTVSGGEPLEQVAGVAALLRRVKAETELSVVMFTGFAWDELERGGSSSPLPLLCDVDVLIAGRYDRTQPLGQRLRGSANQTVHLLTNRYTLEDLEVVPPAEVVFTPAGDVVMSGVRPLRATGLRLGMDHDPG
jgi:anaerobic ribonucleoside-triphosphate reductase activating protein